MKQEEIVGYLPHKLKCFYREDIYILNGIRKESELITVDVESDDYIDTTLLEKIKPIFHPPSDLTKHITVDGYDNNEPFIPVFDMTFLTISKDKFIKLVEDGHVTLAPYNIIQRLYEWHFDIHGLIATGEAIDINEVKKCSP